MVGGMEKVSFALAQEFKKQFPTTLISWGKSQKFLPLVLPLFFFKSLYLLTAKKIDHIHIGDALLSPLALLLKVLYRKKTSVTVMGLDITFNFPGYQLIIPRCVARMDKIICISNSTLKECVRRGIPREKCTVIPCGVYPEEFRVKATRADLEKIVRKSLKGKRVIITVGRLVRRKGVYWFIKNVFPKLENDFIYLVIGEGPEKTRIINLIHDLKIKERVLLLGQIPNQDLKIIYNTADIFIMPNMKVKNNVEGFGIVAIEASSTGLPVIASNMQGITDAVIEGKTGYLVEPGNSGEFIRFSNLKFEKKSVRQQIKLIYNWERITNQYLKIISN